MRTARFIVAPAAAALLLAGLPGAVPAADAEPPASGQGFYYLLRGDNACGVGLYGRNSGGGEEVILACP